MNPIITKTSHFNKLCMGSFAGADISCWEIIAEYDLSAGPELQIELTEDVNLMDTATAVSKATEAATAVSTSIEGCELPAKATEVANSIQFYNAEKSRVSCSQIIENFVDPAVYKKLSVEETINLFENLEYPAGRKYNAKLQFNGKRCIVIAAKDIEKGEEIYVRYGIQYHVAKYIIDKLIHPSCEVSNFKF